MGKKDGKPKKPNNKEIWYKSLIDGQSKAEYYRHFIRKLNNITTEYFGEDETRRVLKAIESQRVEVPGIESFLFNHKDISDPSLSLYNTCKSIEEYVARSIVYFKQRAETGETDIHIKEFFIVLTDFLSTEKEYSPLSIQEILKNFIMALVTATNKSPYTFVLMEQKWLKRIGEQLSLNVYRYPTIVVSIFSIIEELIENLKGTGASLPNIKVLYPVYEDVRENQLTYIIFHFRLSEKSGFAKQALSHIECLDEDTPQLRSALEYIRSVSGLSFISIDTVIEELKSIRNTDCLKRYSTKNSLSEVLKNYGLKKSYFKKYGIEPLFVNRETFENSLVSYFCEVRINCSKLKEENIESFIDAAKTVNLVKGYYFKNKRDIDSLTFKITLINVEHATEEFMRFIRNKLERIKSSTNKNFIIEVCYDEDVIHRRVPEDIISHFRIISDIHADYNEKNRYVFNFGNDYVLNCGDTGGNAVVEANWVNNCMKYGAMVVGNHFGYSSSHPEKDGIQNIEQYKNTKHLSNTKGAQVGELFSLLGGNVSLLSNTCIEFKGIVIIGTCLYTDFDLYGREHREECMAVAKKYMNDFRLPVVFGDRYYTQEKSGIWAPWTKKKAESVIRTFEPSDHAFYFQHSFKFIKRKVEENKHKPIVIVTHHAPSPYAIAEKYKGDLLNASFVSNLNKFIIDHPQIRLWCFGHVHNPCDFILGETRLVCCPFGYNNENGYELPNKYGLRVSIEDVKSKRHWRSILYEDVKRGSIKVYTE